MGGEEFQAALTALTTARGVMVAPANWSNTPPSFFTAHCATESVPSDLPSKPRIHFDLPTSILSPRPGVSTCFTTRTPSSVPPASTPTSTVMSAA